MNIDKMNVLQLKSEIKQHKTIYCKPISKLNKQALKIYLDELREVDKKTLNEDINISPVAEKVTEKVAEKVAEKKVVKKVVKNANANDIEDDGRDIQTLIAEAMKTQKNLIQKPVYKIDKSFKTISFNNETYSVESSNIAMFNKTMNNIKSLNKQLKKDREGVFKLRADEKKELIYTIRNQLKILDRLSVKH